jgi:hypothetical protein
MVGNSVRDTDKFVAWSYCAWLVLHLVMVLVNNPGVSTSKSSTPLGLPLFIGIYSAMKLEKSERGGYWFAGLVSLGLAGILIAFGMLLTVLLSIPYLLVAIFCGWRLFGRENSNRVETVPDKNMQPKTQEVK